MCDWCLLIRRDVQVSFVTYIAKIGCGEKRSQISHFFALTLHALNCDCNCSYARRTKRVALQFSFLASFCLASHCLHSIAVCIASREIKCSKTMIYTLASLIPLHLSLALWSLPCICIQMLLGKRAMHRSQKMIEVENLLSERVVLYCSNTLHCWLLFTGALFSIPSSTARRESCSEHTHKNMYSSAKFEFV